MRRIAMILLAIVASTTFGAQAVHAAGPAPATEAGTARVGRAGQEPGSATDSLVLSLVDAVARGVEANEDVLMARAEKARLEGSATEVRARSLPDLSLDIGYTRNVQTPVLFFNTEEGVEQVSIGSDNDYSLGLSFSQPLVDLSLGPARAAARLSRSASEAQVEAARVQVAMEVRMAYYSVLLDEALLRVQEQALEQAQVRLGQVEAFFEAGTGSEFDLLTAQVEVDNIRPEVIEARNRLELDRNRLKRVIGVSLDRHIELADTLGEPGAAPALEEAVAAAWRARSDLDGQRLRVRLQEENLSAESRSAFPTLSLQAGFQRRASSNDLLPPERDFSQSATAGLAFSLPLFDGRSRAGQVQQAEAELRREEFRLRRLRENVRLEVQQAHQSLESARERLAASRATVGRAERALEIAQTRFSNGLATQVEVNDAELAVTRSRTNAVEARYALNVAWARLRRAMGER